ncbi:MAG: NosD domain-containing protein [Candidatus Bathyarchaeia archaeon]
MFGTGISVTYSNETIISNNIASNNLFGISAGQSNNTQIISNIASNNHRLVDSTHYGTAISIANTRNNTVTGNTVADNGMGISLLGPSGSNNTIHNNTITGTYNNGIYLAGSRNNTIVENKVFSNFYGIYVCDYSQGNTIINNNISANSYRGIYFDRSTNNFLIDNILFKNIDGIVFENNVNNNIILHNTILNSSSFGIYIRSDSNNNMVVGNNISNNDRGIRFTQSNNNTIFGNIISSNTNDGLVIYYYSSNNKVIGNNITLNNYGISITYGCYNNKIFHNNFVDNAQHVFTNMNSTWDNGYPPGGNYWDNYTGVDFKWGITQNETGSDGIGDTAYSINENNTDCYPLMGPINIFETGIWDTTIQYVDVISNSTVSNFQINMTEKVVSFNVTGEAGAGFCRVIIPKIIVDILWLGNYAVLVNGVPVEFRNWTDLENVYLYFEYQHSEKEITIMTEFPFAAITAILTLTTTLTLILRKIRRNVHN